MPKNDDDYITVTEFNNSVKNILMSNIKNIIKLRGEVSNIKMSNKNIYMTLKDVNSSLNIVSWGNDMQNIKNGDDVIVTGKLSFYIKQGSYQISATKIEKIGIGNIYEQYEKMKNNFQHAGYFSKKRQLPKKINRIGILTSVEGAAIQDVMYVLNKHNFSGEVYIKNCNVQGTSCPQSVSDGIKYFNRLHKTKFIDILLITRGGGSFEDLMGYSSEEIVRSIFESQIFTISAIGHEIDNMLSDFAADCRSPTPSIAGEIITTCQREQIELLEKYDNDLNNLKSNIEKKISSCADELKYAEKTLSTLKPINIVDNELDNLNNIKKKLQESIKNNIEHISTEIYKLNNMNESYNISKIMNNGYVILIDKEKNSIINSKYDMENKIKNNKKLKIIFFDGEYEL